ncbi:MAG: hypothetical protein SGARI_001557 [Bacillariaceae sp.]
MDAGVPASVKTFELYNQNLPLSMQKGNDDDKDLELLRHWVEELDGFEARMNGLRDSLCAGADVIVGDDADNDETEMGALLGELEVTDWMTSDNTDDETMSVSSYSSSLYRLMLDLLDEIKTLDGKIVSATEARDALASLSSKDSAYAALDRARKMLLDATDGITMAQGLRQKNSSKVASSAEQTHQLLNQVEDALLECGGFLDDEENGLIASLEEVRRKCPVSAEELLEYITEFNTLARKHGMTPYQLPSCHSSLRKELEGGVEARIMLPKALEEEKKALDALKEGCEVLTRSRSNLCDRLSKSINQQLPLLGMANSRFEARLRPLNNPTYGRSHLGVEEVDFYLRHGGTDDHSSRKATEGRLESVASSGEKARILLSIECHLPGSVRALCGGTPTEANGGSDDEEYATTPPVAVVYDEIDAHVGGRASVSVAQMLVEQARSCQVLSITHSPSLAALANTHICVSKVVPASQEENEAGSSLRANAVDGVERQKELARMASGDMASEEAELFAKALLRDASLNARSSRYNATTTTMLI